MACHIRSAFDRLRTRRHVTELNQRVEVALVLITPLISKLCARVMRSLSVSSSKRPPAPERLCGRSPAGNEAGCTGPFVLPFLQGGDFGAQHRNSVMDDLDFAYLPSRYHKADRLPSRTSGQSKEVPLSARFAASATYCLIPIASFLRTPSLPRALCFAGAQSRVPP